MPAPPSEGSVDGLRVGGFAVLALAGAELLRALAFGFFSGFEGGSIVSGIVVAVAATLGLLMLQGNDAARRVLGWFGVILTGLNPLLLIGLVVLGSWHLWPLFVAWALVSGGVMLLARDAEPRREIAAGALAMMGVGWIGSVAAAIPLAGTVDVVTTTRIARWSSGLRAVEDTNAGFALQLPPGWVALKPWSPFTGVEKPLTTLAHTRILGVAEIERSDASVDVDALAGLVEVLGKAKAEKVTQFHTLETGDATIGEVPAKKMKASWVKNGVDETASMIAWQDVDTFYVLSVTAPSVLGARIDTELGELVRGLTVTQPWTAFARDTAPAIQTECPLLSDVAIVRLARMVTREAAPETYCREGYRLASKGQAGIEGAPRQRFNLRMQSFFAGVPPANAGRFQAIIEKFRAGQQTTPAEDKLLTDTVRRAMTRMSADAQTELRTLFALAIESGRFAESLGRR